MSLLLSNRRLPLAGLICFALLPAAAWAATTNYFSSVADASLLEVAPNNNLGGFAGMNAGTTQEYKRTRALFRFDLGSMPANAVVLSASVRVTVTREPGPGEPSNSSTFGLHRLLRPWGEGEKNPAAQPGKGLPATPGEATWNHAFFSTNAWTSPGGASGTDFSGTESSFQLIYGTDTPTYVFENTPEMIADVSAWLQQPGANFGWLLRCSEEDTQSTARRFGTREDVGNEPLLQLEYLVPPTLQISRPNATQIQVHFTAWADHNYDVFYRDSLTAGNWLSLTNLSATPTNYPAVITEPVSGSPRFYRVSAY